MSRVNIVWKGSPNYTSGRRASVSKIIIHWIVGNLSSADATFSRSSSKVSAHYAVEDNTVHQYVRDADTAWHAMSANPFSIGIEHSAAPGRLATDATYETSANLIADICQKFGLNPHTAVEPHSKYVATQCCGTMDLNRLKNRAAEILGSSPVTQPSPPPPATSSGYEQLHPGSRGANVLRLQTKLKELGLYNDALDGNYGPITTNSVKNYQRAKGLAVDGWAGPITQGALYSQKTSPIKRVLSRGMKGEDVKYLQQRLNAKGLYSDAIDGAFGPITQASVKRLQSKHGLVADGYVGPITRIAVG